MQRPRDAVKGSRPTPDVASFPAVAGVTVRVAPLDGDAPERVFKTGELGPTIACIDPNCDGGGFRIQELLEEMVRKHERTRDEMATCVGNERLPGRGKRRGRVLGHCTRIYRVRIDVKYKKS